MLTDLSAPNQPYHQCLTKTTPKATRKAIRDSPGHADRRRHRRCHSFSPFAMLVPNVTVFFALSEPPAVSGLFFFFFLPEEPPPAAFAPFLGGVRNDPGGGIDSSGDEVPAGDAGEAAPSTEDRFFFFFFLSEDESGVTVCVNKARIGGGTGSGKEKGRRHLKTSVTDSFGPSYVRSLFAWGPFQTRQRLQQANRKPICEKKRPA